MNPLSQTLRKQLERTIVDARDVAESGSLAAFQALAVHERESYRHMDGNQRALRRRLRAHGRQLGDRRDARSGKQAIERLVRECAYEHWHGMLFARFLAENRLLIEPELEISVTLEECEELAKDKGTDNWVLAARFAQRMLPQVFRPDHPVFEVRLAREHRLKLEGLVEGLPVAVFTATDSLGWVYQFWQSRKKAEVNRSEAKIGADELPAVTQLFTEPYMVRFLLDNSLGAWWAAHRLNAFELRTADSEVELRRNASIPGVPLDYLRFVRREAPAENGRWNLAAGAFGNWPRHLARLKIMDPSCGSGHFLVAAFLMLVPMRMTLEDLDAYEAVDAVLGHNLHGLELDPRCVQIAAFALALAAWTYPGAEGYRPLPELNLACSGLAPNSSKEEWAALSESAAAAGGLPPDRDLLGIDDNLLSSQLRTSLEALHDIFAQAPVLGSLIDPRSLEADLVQRDYESVRELFAVALEQERTSDEEIERAVAARGMARAAELLAGQYHLLITNVPYLAHGKQGSRLSAFGNRYYPSSKNDLATVFLERCMALCAEGGTVSLVLPQNWLFLKTYRKLREKLLKSRTWHLLARLGSGAFETISGEVVKAILAIMSRGSQSDHRSVSASGIGYVTTAYGLDVAGHRKARDKAANLGIALIESTTQLRMLDNPDARIVFQDISKTLMEKYVRAHQGISTGDNPSKRRYFWEQPQSDRWVYFHSTVKDTTNYGGMSSVLDWKYSGLDMAALRGKSAWRNNGVAVSQMNELPVALYRGAMFDTNIAALPAVSIEQLAAIWCYCSSPEYHDAVRQIDQKLNVTNATLVKVPFDLQHWTRVAEKRYPNSLPRPYSDDLTQWIFHGHPCGSVVWNETEGRVTHGALRTDANVLHVAVARLLGYRWPAENDSDMELADEQREWVGRCSKLLRHADADGIVCIPSVRGEPPAGERLLLLLSTAFGGTWDGGVLAGLLAEVGSPTLDQWLRNQFFEQHCKLFHQRPFIWHIWDGRIGDGFHALVNYHKLAEAGGKGRQLMESLTFSYLGDWVARQQDGVTRGETGAEERLAAALELRSRLTAILEGEPPYDIFVRWKPLSEHAIGWEPDVNDGVRTNIRPFMAEDIPGGKTGAGVLRVRPNVHWRKDRGKEPFREREDFPWFWHDGEFTADRLNNCHLTVSSKRESHDRVESRQQ